MRLAKCKERINNEMNEKLDKAHELMEELRLEEITRLRGEIKEDERSAEIRIT